MPEPPPTGFFAYPSTPKTISETIQTAVSTINRSGLVSIKVWEDCRIGGKVIVDEICKEITNADLFCADLTHLNANVMFELGFAIAKNRRVWLLLDTSIVEARKRFDQLRILTTVGYANYCNSRDIEQAFYKESPYSDLKSTIFEMAIYPNLPQGNQSKLVYLKNKHNTEASTRISKRVEDSRIPLVISTVRVNEGVNR